jgi:hypothetical protein
MPTGFEQLGAVAGILNGFLQGVIEMRFCNFLAIAVLVMPVTVLAADPVEINYEMQRLDARFRLFKTSNTWNFLELDTQTGKVWQVQFSVGEKDSRLKIEVRPDAVPGATKPGRFTLYPTRNMYNFILLDQDAGKTWQVQWSTDKEQGSWPIEQGSGKADAGWKQ